MGGDETLDAAAAVAIDVGRAPGQHDFEDIQEVLGDLQVGRVAGVVECDQDLVRQPARMPWQAGRRSVACNVLRGDKIFDIVFNIVFHITPRIIET